MFFICFSTQLTSKSEIHINIIYIFLYLAIFLKIRKNLKFSIKLKKQHFQTYLNTKAAEKKNRQKILKRQVHKVQKVLSTVLFSIYRATIDSVNYDWLGKFYNDWDSLFTICFLHVGIATKTWGYLLLSAFLFTIEVDKNTTGFLSLTYIYVRGKDRGWGWQVGNWEEKNHKNLEKVYLENSVKKSCRYVRFCLQSNYWHTYTSGQKTEGGGRSGRWEVGTKKSQKLRKSIKKIRYNKYVL